MYTPGLALENLLLRGLRLGDVVQRAAVGRSLGPGAHHCVQQRVAGRKRRPRRALGGRHELERHHSAGRGRLVEVELLNLERAVGAPVERGRLAVQVGAGDGRRGLARRA